MDRKGINLSKKEVFFKVLNDALNCQLILLPPLSFTNLDVEQISWPWQRPNPFRRGFVCFSKQINIFIVKLFAFKQPTLLIFKLTSSSFRKAFRTHWWDHPHNFRFPEEFCFCAKWPFDTILTNHLRLIHNKSKS